MHLCCTRESCECTANQENISCRSPDVDLAGDSCGAWILSGGSKSETSGCVLEDPPSGCTGENCNDKSSMQTRTRQQSRKPSMQRHGFRLGVNVCRFLQWTANQKRNQVQSNEVQHDSADHFEHMKTCSELSCDPCPCSAGE